MQNDYISREALVKELMARDFYPAIVRRAIEAIPAADVRPVVHGKWTLNRDGSGTCNECGMTQKNVWDDDMHQRYCGCCGVRMDGGSNNA